ncbi:MAG TPA: pantoate--beta-alanine ligase [Candidatus Thioglobus autotrophicus]|nr:pantoate--beta-alanine ligase [Candidatus Thioglobus autotrophicus]
MQVCSNNQQIIDLISQWKGKGETVAFVPTMGGLHDGHLSLVSKAAQVADRVVVSIFINPTQFSQNEDFDNYPETLSDDLTLLENYPVDVVFTPTAEQIYPKGLSSDIKAGSLAQGLCGGTRPGHFDGVVQVVYRLFEIVTPTVAIFGQKDYQQLLVIRQMVEAQALAVEILSGAIIRENDGLAMSTRNQYLTKAQRQLAPELYKQLSVLKQQILSGGDVISSTKHTQEGLEKHFKVEYLSVLDANTLKSITDNTAKITILCAVFLGSTRLIDNIIFNQG